MEIEFDPAKEEINLTKHDGIFLSDAAFLFEGPHQVEIDDRFDYEEIRLVATGEIAGRLHVCVYTTRGQVHRIISLRKANRREIDDYREG